MTAAAWRPMAPADLKRVEAIAAAVHPAYPESGAVPAERLRLFPAGCHVLDAGGETLAYVVSHPWRSNDPPKLDSLLGAIPAEAGTYYIHDLALLPDARGKGHADAIISRLTTIAAGLRLATLSLVAVNRSAGFWSRHGFAPATSPSLRAALSSYDDDAVFMERRLR